MSSENIYNLKVNMSMIDAPYMNSEVYNGFYMNLNLQENLLRWT